MASASFNLYGIYQTPTEFDLAQTSATKTTWIVGGRAINKPFSLSIERKLTPQGSVSNDHILVRVTRTEANAVSGKLATASATLDLSIPKDSSVLDESALVSMLGLVASFLNEKSTLAGTTAVRSALVEGRDA